MHRRKQGVGEDRLPRRRGHRPGCGRGTGCGIRRRGTTGEIDEAFARIHALGEERVWVTPKVPFMIPLLVGFVLAFGVGDILSGAMVHFLPRR